MRRNNAWNRWVGRLGNVGERKTRKRYQRRRMFLEPLETRTLLAADLLLDNAGNVVEQGGGAEWVDELVRTKNSSVQAITSRSATFTAHWRIHP